MIFARDVDAIARRSGTFELRDGFDQLVPVASAQVPAGRPNVVELTLARALPAGSYQLTVRGQGPVALADNAGHVLDGDADGVAGGDFLMSFDVSAGAQPMSAQEADLRTLDRRSLLLGAALQATPSRTSRRRWA